MYDYHVWQRGARGYLTVSGPNIDAVAAAFPKANIFSVSDLSNYVARFDPLDGTPIQVADTLQVDG